MQTNERAPLAGMLYSDDPDLVGTVSPALHSFGVQTYTVTDPEQAIDHMPMKRLDCVVVDFRRLEADRILRSVRGSTVNRECFTAAIVTDPALQRAAFEAGATLAMFPPATTKHAARCLRPLLGAILRRRRNAYRVPASLAAQVRLRHDTTAIKATVTDLSRTGLALRCEGQIPAGASLSVTFRLPDTRESAVHATASVCWVGLRGFSCGVQFSHMSARHRTVLDHWLDKMIPWEDINTSVA